MVFRRIKKGTYTIGDGPIPFNGSTGSNNFGGNTAHNVYFPADYYMTIFRLTVGQYERIVNANNSSVTGYKRISYVDARTTAGVTALPGTGVLLSLSNKSGLKMDLPTHAMWETAARATLRSTCISGETLDNFGDYNVWSGNTSGGYSADIVMPAGSKKPNPWGFYDVNGCRWIWVRDLHDEKTNLATCETALPNGFTPLTIQQRDYRIMVGGHGWNVPEYWQKLSCFYPYYTTYSDTEIFIACYPAAYYPNGGR